ncbi:hypothetical protein AAFF_G00088570 [Aldrovandia affinis]|uniref:Uncharacterized protein n=1 Tax=Aldrovandia affinis TaxID=143900 RepID=A0AAD7RWH2_9TELE|nr:hypothetical protein AAFF_G00088570 [Aldrovandia affinis]
MPADVPGRAERASAMVAVSRGKTPHDRGRGNSGTGGGQAGRQAGRQLPLREKRRGPILQTLRGALSPGKDVERSGLPTAGPLEEQLGRVGFQNHLHRGERQEPACH